MKTAGYWELTATFCGVAIWAGWSLGRHPETGHVLPDENSPAARLESMKTDFPSDEGTLLRQAAAKCDTAALWQWMREHSDDPGLAIWSVAEELLDREGPDAIQHACEIEDDEKRARISEQLLAAYVGKDVWAAYEVYENLRPRFGKNWGSGAVANIFTAASSISADRLIECMSECPGPPAHSRNWFQEDFKAGFDFRKMADYLSSVEVKPKFTPIDFLGSWAHQHPVEAVAWVSEDHPGSYASGPDGEAEISGRFDTSFLNSVIKSDAGVEERIKALRSIPEKDRNQLWPELLSGEWSAGESGVLDSKYLDAAEVMTGREDFLARKLLETRGLAELDASWSAVPAGERKAVIQECLRRWEKEQPTSLGKQAREQWQAWLGREWR